MASSCVDVAVSGGQMALVAAAFALVIKVLAFRGATDGRQKCFAKVAEEFVFVDFLRKNRFLIFLAQNKVLFY